MADVRRALDDSAALAAYHALGLWIDAHHFQHHRKHNTNLNVVLPIADFLFRTRVRPPKPTVVAALAAAG